MESWHHVLCSSLRAVGQQLSIWLTVQGRVWQRGQLGSDWIFHQQRLTGVGRQSIQPNHERYLFSWERKHYLGPHKSLMLNADNFPGALIGQIRIQGENSSGCVVCFLIKVLLKDFTRERTETVGGVDGGLAGMMFRHPGGIHSLFPKAGSEICPCISLRFRSFDTCTEARSLSLAFSWT